MLWYYVANSEKVGPFDTEEFNKLIIDETITAKTLIWNETFEDWQQFGTIDYEVVKPADGAIITDKKDESGDDAAASDITQQDTAKKPTGHKISFFGSAGEYFRIWIVNLFLTIITLGIYAAWAKVRTKKYFFANTKLDGESFDYLASPLTILKGNLIIGGAFILFQVTTVTLPILSLFVLLAFFAVLPFLIYKSLCFSARNTAFRNIRFKFNGSLKESYKIFLFLPICFPLTMGLIAPYWSFRFKKYFYKNFSFGSARNKFTGTPGFFYETMLLAMGVMILIMIGLIIIIAAVGVVIANFQDGASHDMRIMQGIIVPLTILFYIIAIVIGTALKTFIYVKLTNYSFENTSIGDVKINSEYSAKSLLWIRMTNIAAIIFSVGLLAPWAIVRTFRYMAENIIVFSDMDLERFTASKDVDVSAIGESAADFFDMEIGL